MWVSKWVCVHGSKVFKPHPERSQLNIFVKVKRPLLMNMKCVATKKILHYGSFFLVRLVAFLMALVCIYIYIYIYIYVCVCVCGGVCGCVCVCVCVTY